MKGIILFGGLQGGGGLSETWYLFGRGTLFFKSGFLLAKTDSRANTALVI